jgi:hypothetical protein
MQIPRKSINILLSLTLILILLVTFSLFKQTKQLTLTTEFAKAGSLGSLLTTSLESMPSQRIVAQGDKYLTKVQDSTVDSIQETIVFPKNYAEALEVKLDGQRSVQITDLNAQGYASRLIYGEATATPNFLVNAGANTQLSETGQANLPTEPKYISYKSSDDRKTIYYAYQKNRQNLYRQVKSWVYYQNGTGQERESYKLDNAYLRLNTAGGVEVFYQASLVSQSDMARLIAERQPDFTIPKPFYLDKNKQKHDLDWQISADQSIISVNLRTDINQYPLALDPTLTFNYSYSAGLITYTSSSYGSTTIVIPSSAVNIIATVSGAGGGGDAVELAPGRDGFAGDKYIVELLNAGNKQLDMWVGQGGFGGWSGLTPGLGGFGYQAGASGTVQTQLAYEGGGGGGGSSAIIDQGNANVMVQARGGTGGQDINGGGGNYIHPTYIASSTFLSGAGGAFGIGAQVDWSTGSGGSDGSITVVYATSSLTEVLRGNLKFRGSVKMH